MLSGMVAQHFRFLQNCQTVFQTSCTTMSTLARRFSFLISLPAFGGIAIFNFSHSDGWM